LSESCISPSARTCSLTRGRKPRAQNQHTRSSPQRSCPSSSRVWEFTALIPQSVYFQPFVTCWHREVMQEHMNTWCRRISTELRSQISPEHLETHADLWFYSTQLSLTIKLRNFSQMNHCHHHQHHLCSISCYPRYYSSAK